jgi:riboflavin synthase
MGGHFVSGHVDGVATLLAVEPVATSEDSYLIRLRVPAGMERYLVYKGSVCLNGISLTIASVTGEEFTVAVIPYTWHQTNLRKASPGSQLNFEADLLAKYVDKILSFRGQETSEA